MARVKCETKLASRPGRSVERVPSFTELIVEA
jgi:hypothetical protein